MSDEFLVVYDYGMGGLWAVVAAQSATAITDRYPEVQVVADRPTWLTEERYANLARLRLDDHGPGTLFRAVLADRDRE
jgi:hypothetical protein